MSEPKAIHDVPPPVRTGKPAETLDLTGKVLPWDADGRVALLGVMGLGPAVPVFSTADKLRAAARVMPLPFASIKQIVHGQAFLDSIPGDVPVIVDPWVTPEGKVRYTMVLRG